MNLAQRLVIVVGLVLLGLLTFRAETDPGAHGIQAFIYATTALTTAGIVLIIGPRRKP